MFQVWTDLIQALKTPSKYYCPVVTDGMGVCKLILGGGEYCSGVFLQCIPSHRDFSESLRKDGWELARLGTQEVTQSIQLVARCIFSNRKNNGN